MPAKIDQPSTAHGAIYVGRMPVNLPRRNAELDVFDFQAESTKTLEKLELGYLGTQVYDLE